MLSSVLDALSLAVIVAFWVYIGVHIWLLRIVTDSEATSRLCERIEQGRFPFL